MSTTYWPAFSARLNLSTLLTNPIISLERVRKYEIHPHPPVKVVNPDWGRSTLTTAFSGPNLKATWLGLAVRRSSTSRGSPPLITQVFLFSFVPSVSSSSFRVTPKA